MRLITTKTASPLESAKKMLFATLLFSITSLITSCERHENNADLKLMAVGDNMVEVMIRNRKEAMQIPNDLLYGPHNLKDSVYFQAFDKQGKEIPKCSRAMLSPSALGSSTLASNKEIIIRVPLGGIKSAYCEEKMSLRIVRGYIDSNEKLAPIDVSNSIEILTKGDGGN